MVLQTSPAMVSQLAQTFVADYLNYRYTSMTCTTIITLTMQSQTKIRKPITIYIVKDDLSTTSAFVAEPLKLVGQVLEMVLNF